MRALSGSSSSRIFAVMLAGMLLTGVLAGCTGSGNGSSSSGSLGASDSKEMTAGQFPAEKPKPAQSPPPPMFKSPETAVYSYLLWISYAYRILNSDVATMTFGPYEEVRVNSYVELNRQKGQALDQRLVDFRVNSVTSEGATATVSASETWKYRYIDIKTGKYTGPVNDATYATIYTVVNGKTGWLVDSVKAEPVGQSPK